MRVVLEHKTGLTVALERKDAQRAPVGVAAATTDEGVVIAVVGVTGVKDDVDDIVLPGAYTKTLAERRPKVCWSHSWEDPVGRVLHIEELPPGDPRLPSQTKDGKPWPKDAGALIATMQFNLDSERGREAFAAVKFFSRSGECAWSIGYAVPPGQSTKRADGVRLIKTLELYELSFVLHGAAPLATTLDLKSAVTLMLERKDAVPAAADGDPFGEVLFPSTDGPGGDPGSGDPEHPNDLPPMGEDDWAHIDTLAPADDAPDGEDDVEHPVDEAKLLGTPDWAPEVKRSFSTSKRRELAKRGHALPDGSFPISSEEDVRNAVQAIGRAKSGDRAKIKAHILKRARALGCMDAVPDDWQSGKAAAAVVELKYDTGPVGNPGGQQNWVDKAGGLPPFVRAVAHAMIRNGHDESRAIALAVAAIKRWAAGGGDVSEKTRAKARAALARWEAMKAGKTAEQVTGWDPALEVGPLAGTQRPSGVELKYAGPPRLAGTWEERIDALHNAVRALLTPPTPRTPPDGPVPPGGGYVCVVGTYDDRIVATLERYDEPIDGRDRDTTYEIPYTWSADGTPILGGPEEVQLALTVEDIDGPDGDSDEDESDDSDAAVAGGSPMLVLPMVLDHAAFAAKMLTRQGKAGRVLSGMNAEQIRGAVRTLVSVLRAAGVNLDDIVGAPAGSAEAKTLGGEEELDAAEVAAWAALAASVRGGE